jgi:hypothetical protein
VDGLRQSQKTPAGQPSAFGVVAKGFSQNCRLGNGRSKRWRRITAERLARIADGSRKRVNSFPVGPLQKYGTFAPLCTFASRQSSSHKWVLAVPENTQFSIPPYGGHRSCGCSHADHSLRPVFPFWVSSPTPRSVCEVRSTFNNNQLILLLRDVATDDQQGQTQIRK